MNLTDTMTHYSTFQATTNSAKQEVGTFMFEGQEFCALGSIIDHAKGRAVGYPARDGELLVLKSWGGRVIGTAGKVTARWPVTSWLGSHMEQMEFTIDGKRYTGRGFGTHTMWRGKLKKGGR